MMWNITLFWQHKPFLFCASAPPRLREIKTAYIRPVAVFNAIF